MRKIEMARVVECVKLLEEAHEEINKKIQDRQFDNVQILLSECQEVAIGIGTVIEKSEGEGHSVVFMLEKYCELVYSIYQQVMASDALASHKVYKILSQQLLKISNSINNEIKVQREIVFLPYKASMWDSLESVWLEYSTMNDCDTYVIPIPYFDKNPDGTFKEMHYEADLYPANIPITNYMDYDFELRKPDEIYIHNPYDQLNIVTSVHPSFYSDILIKYTNKLVYIPYFVLEEIEPDDKQGIESIKHFVTLPAIMNSDLIILQSEKMKQCYVQILSSLTGEHTKTIWEERIIGSGSPKYDKILNTQRDELQIPSEWVGMIEQEDGSHKKIILYNVSIAAFLSYDNKMIDKIKSVLAFFKNRSDVVLLFRPHPLLEETLASMRPKLVMDYLCIIKQYIEENWGIFDDTPEIDRAIILCDAYYGDQSSVVQLCKAVNKPIMIQNVEVILENRG